MGGCFNHTMFVVVLKIRRDGGVGESVRMYKFFKVRFLFIVDI